MVPEVLQAVQDAFAPQQTESHLKEKNGRVFGSVKVIGSATFDNLDDARRQDRLWVHLVDRLGAEWFRVGPIVLEPSRRG